MRRLIIGDIHGQYNRMIDVLNRSHYDPDKDELYPVGDFCDRGPRPVEVLDFIYSLPNCHPVIGNHDLYLMEYLSHTIPSYRLDNWLRQRNGGWITLKEVDKQSIKWQNKVLDRLMSTPFVRMVDSNIIVHGGFSIEMMENHNPVYYTGKSSKDISKEEYINIFHEIAWDRTLIYSSKEEKEDLSIPWSNRFFLGHTPIINEDHKPYITSSIIDIDTGSFVSQGAITVIDVDTLEYWHSTVPVENI